MTQDWPKNTSYSRCCYITIKKAKLWNITYSSKNDAVVAVIVGDGDGIMQLHTFKSIFWVAGSRHTVVKLPSCAPVMLW